MVKRRAHFDSAVFAQHVDPVEQERVAGIAVDAVSAHRHVDGDDGPDAQQLQTLALQRLGRVSSQVHAAVNKRIVGLYGQGQVHPQPKIR